MFKGKIEWTIFPRINCLWLEGKAIQNKEFKKQSWSSESRKRGMGEIGELTAISLDTLLALT